MNRSNDRIRRCSRSIAWPNMISTSALARCWLPICATALRPSSASRACAPTVRCDSSASAPALGRVARKYADAAATNDARSRPVASAGGDDRRHRDAAASHAAGPAFSNGRALDARRGMAREHFDDFIGDAGRRPQAADHLQGPFRRLGDEESRPSRCVGRGVDGRDDANRPRRLRDLLGVTATQFHAPHSTASHCVGRHASSDVAGRRRRSGDRASPACPRRRLARWPCRIAGSSSVSAGVSGGRGPNCKISSANQQLRLNCQLSTSTLDSDYRRRTQSACRTST